MRQHALAVISSCFILFAGCTTSSDSTAGGGSALSGGANGTGAQDPAGGSAAGGSAASGSAAGGSAAGGSAAGGNAGSGGSGTGGSQSGGCGDPPLTAWELMMLSAHNAWRASVDPPADQMYTLHWDRAIAENAANWVASCDPEWPHSPEEARTNIGGYDVLGENLSYCAGSACSEHSDVTDGSGLGDGEGWWEERHDYNWEDDSSTGITSHYTQMVSSNVYAVGCATQLCEAPGPGGWDGSWWWTICQYGPRGQAYWVGTKPYDAGPGGLVEPPSEVYQTHPGLCEAP